MKDPTLMLLRGFLMDALARKPKDAAFRADLEATVRWARGRRSAPPRNALTQRFCRFLIEDFAAAMDAGAYEGKGETAKAVNEVLAGVDARRLSRETAAFVSACLGSRSAAVQMASDPGTDARQDIRATLRGSHPDALPVLTVEPSLLGGMRLFLDGKLRDESWSAAVKRLIHAS